MQHRAGGDQKGAAVRRGEARRGNQRHRGCGGRLLVQVERASEKPSFAGHLNELKAPSSKHLTERCLERNKVGEVLQRRGLKIVSLPIPLGSLSLR